MNRRAQRSDQRAPMRPRGFVIRTAANRFDVDRSAIPEGYTWEWKRLTIAGMEDKEHQANLSLNGWEAVPIESVPESMKGLRAQSEGFFERGGQVLMQRPAEITEEVQDYYDFEAKQQIANMLQKLKEDGRLVGRDAGVRRIREPIPDLVE